MTRRQLEPDLGGQIIIKFDADLDSRSQLHIKDQFFTATAGT